mmetsp:Transcript_33658/g.85103  ORF Transcript_33658/g.85103 Transcript_33658/m.85103 type:complete len:230 (+) Transcript_33658:64-753(+)
MGCFPFLPSRDLPESHCHVPAGNMPQTPSWRSLSPDQIKQVSAIVPGVWLGSNHAAADHANLKRLGITHILNLAGRDAYAGDIVLFDEQVRNRKDTSMFTYKDQEIKDTRQARLSNVFPDTTRFIREGAAAGGVLVHCMMGVSRSSSVLLAYLIDSKGMTYDDAFALVKSRRQAAIPNSGFVKQLRDYEKKRGRGAKAPADGSGHGSPSKSGANALQFLADKRNYDGVV